jgi:hypothetical protein
LPLLLLAACGGREKQEAVRLSQTLTASKDGFAKVNASENEFLTATRSWCSGIVTSGAGKAADLDAKAEGALALSKASTTVSADIGAFSKTLSAITLEMEPTRAVRAGLLDQLANRQRSLYEMKVLLDESAPALRSLRDNKEYKGDSFPAPVGKLNDKLLNYRVREGLLDDAVAELKERYKLE